MSSSPFQLTKWYLDCVTADGDAAILYCGVLRWRGVSIAFNSVLTLNAYQVESRTSMARARVHADADLIEVSAPRLAVKGCWRRIGQAFRTRVFESTYGEVDWDCVQTSSAVQLQCGARVFEGLGYAECLTVTVPPWRLPMKQLRWGRFVCADHALAWIDWQGDFSMSFAILDGQVVRLATVSEEEVRVNGARLAMSASLPLRRGKLGATVLPSAPRLGKLLPQSLGAIEEHKWRSRGVFTCGEQSCDGWVIHEVVHWTR